MSAREPLPACFHCGLPLPADGRWSAVVDGSARPMCCPGCAAVADAIVASGFGDYYRERSAFAANAADLHTSLPALALFDLDAADAAGASAGAGEPARAREASFSIDGIRCGACAWLIERRMARVPGVLAADLNLSTERLLVRWDAAVCQPSHFLQALREIGYAGWPFDPARHGEQLERARKLAFRRLFIAGLSMMQVMMYALPVYFAGPGGIEPDMEQLMRWASLLLTLPAVVYSAAPFFVGAWRDLRGGRPGMDVPVALGIAAAFAASVVATARDHGDVYFDSVTMFIFLLLASRYLELLARRKAARALEQLQHALPASAQRIAGYPQLRASTLVAAAELRVGDVIQVAPGQSLAADGIVLEGASAVDVSLLTGESAPQACAPGDALPGGAVNVGQALVLRVTRAAQDSTLALLVKLVERAGHGKPRLALWADRVASWFVVALLVFTVAVFCAWQWFDPARAWEVAIAVLVVSCPCALSLATPSALAAATDSLVRRGVLVVQPHVLETLEAATHVIFDKTGTLTEGHPRLQDVLALAGVDAARCLQLAAALEAGSAHPLAAPLRDAAHAASAGADPATAPAHATGIHQSDGEGVEGTIDGTRYRIGSAAFALAAGAGARPDGAPDCAGVFLGGADGLLARFTLADALRADARDVVRAVQASGKQVILLSGDAPAVVRAVAGQLGVAEAYGAQLPAQKLAFVQALQAKGAVVAMVGDGINDAAVLRAADVSFAMGGGAALAQLHADCVLLSGRLGSLLDAASTARRTARVVRQNLGWAMVYNVVAIPAAAFGLLTPWMAGIGMSLSSAVVVLNALRLRRGGR
jgi:Cu2+-exporting ATPase